ncbi:hypothetical protein P4O66_021357 [Electrophorus voltai]|uniref:Uncharacterized protein n=1 Tax=Electrophorus voltai TaxID=2609070 RepID=A0AAD8ZPD3_9TELE|nr:hypothetical protein P4O66_021357 [Electrophorus voltai]
MQFRTVLDVKVVDVEKRRHPSKHYGRGPRDREAEKEGRKSLRAHTLALPNWHFRQSEPTSSLLSLGLACLPSGVAGSLGAWPMTKGLLTPVTGRSRLVSQLVRSEGGGGTAGKFITPAQLPDRKWRVPHVAPRQPRRGAAWRVSFPSMPVSSVRSKPRLDSQGAPAADGPPPFLLADPRPRRQLTLLGCSCLMQDSAHSGIALGAITLWSSGYGPWVCAAIAGNPYPGRGVGRRMSFVRTIPNEHELASHNPSISAPSSPLVRRANSDRRGYVADCLLQTRSSRDTRKSALLLRL